MGGWQVRGVKVTWIHAVYVAVVAVCAAIGFIIQAPQPILLAAALTLPASIVALPTYYLAYGLLAQIPGANPSSSSGSGSSAGPGSPPVTVTTGDLAPWFAVSTQVLGILLLTVAAFVNIVILQSVLDRRSGPRDARD